MVLAVYQVEVTTQTGHYYRVERRYSAFHSLNKQCKKLGLGPTADFPPKRIRNTSAKVLESRRKGLEHWVQSLARRGPVPQLLLSFLELPPGACGGQAEAEVAASSQQQYTTPVLGYPEDPYLAESEESSDNSDMITEGKMEIARPMTDVFMTVKYDPLAATLVAFYG